MNILNTVKKIPGGLMVVPLVLGAITNTFAPQVFSIGGFTEALLKTGAPALLAAFLLCNGAQIQIKQAGLPVLKGVILLLVKVLIGAILGIIVNYFWGIYGVLGITPLAIIASLTNKNGGLYAALAGEYGDSTDVGAVSVIALSDGPFFTMLAFGATGLAQISFTVLLAALVPILLGLILGNLDDNIRKFLAPGTSILIPLFAFPLGAALNFNQLINAGMSGILLGISCVFITGLQDILLLNYFVLNFRK